jgi:hypothetical protein
MHSLFIYVESKAWLHSGLTAGKSIDARTDVQMSLLLSVSVFSG